MVALLLLSTATSNGRPGSSEVMVWNSLPRLTNVTVVPAATRSSFGAYVHSASFPAGSTTWTSLGRGVGVALAPHAASTRRTRQAPARNIQRRVTKTLRVSIRHGCVGTTGTAQGVEADPRR